jgi:hypothetical protein
MSWLLQSPRTVEQGSSVSQALPTRQSPQSARLTAQVERAICVGVGMRAGAHPGGAVAPFRRSPLLSVPAAILTQGISISGEGVCKIR